MADYFLKIEGVAGDSLDDRHRDEIEVLAFSWGESHPGSPSPGAAISVGRVAIEPFNFTALTGSASPALMLMGANDKAARTAVFVARRAGKAQHEYLKFTLSEVTVASYQISGVDGDTPVDEVSLRFSKIVVDYRPQKATGALGPAIHMGWDVKRNKEA